MNENDIADLREGPVKVTAGEHEGRIGYFDDDYLDDAIVYFGEMLMDAEHGVISPEHLTHVTTYDLHSRRQEIFASIGLVADEADVEVRASLLGELVLVDNLLLKRFISARFRSIEAERMVFLSHSSSDKPFATSLAMDLDEHGHHPWLDEWEIRVGESIPKRIGEGIEECSAMIVILSKRAVESAWVENEWQAKYWEEIRSKRIKVLPALLEKCEIPTLLRPKKYADFTESYVRVLDELLYSLRDPVNLRGSA